METTSELWEKARERIRARVGSKRFICWFSPLELMGMKDGCAVVYAPDNSFKDLIEKNYSWIVRAALQDVAGREFNVRYEVQKKGADGAVCPVCGSTAVYKYGRACTGKQRYLCLRCNRQFTGLGERPASYDESRPKCPACKKPMHRYMKDDNNIRYRCSSYPGCRTFYKMKNTKEAAG